MMLTAAASHIYMAITIDGTFTRILSGVMATLMLLISIWDIYLDRQRAKLQALIELNNLDWDPSIPVNPLSFLHAIPLDFLLDFEEQQTNDTPDW